MNAGLGEILYLEQILRHDVRVLDYPFLERVVAYDCSQPRGRMHTAGDPDELREVMHRLLDNGIIDRADEIPWDESQPAIQRALNQKYFGVPDVPTRAHGGTPIFQYLYALDRARGDYVLHLDADILFYGSKGGAWIDESIAVLREHPDEVVMISPPGGPPQARSAWEALTRRPRRNEVPTERWHRSAGVSARYFLADWRRLKALAPWVRRQHNELFEESLGHTVREKHVGRWTMNGTDCYAVHIHRRTPGFYKHRDDLIWAVENDVYPFLRTGHPWDLRTDRLGLLPWLIAIQMAKMRRRLQKLTGSTRC